MLACTACRPAVSATAPARALCVWNLARAQARSEGDLLRELNTLRSEFRGVRDALADQAKSLKRRQQENQPKIGLNVDRKEELVF